MRSSVVESRPSENLEIRGSDTPFQPGFRIPDLDPQHQSAQSAGRKSPEHQLTLIPGEGWLALLLLGIAVYSVVFSIIFANWVDFSYILLFSTAVGLLLGLCIAKIQRFPQAILHLAAVLLGYWLSIWLVSAFAYHISWLLLLENLRSVISGGFTSAVSSNSEMVFLFYLTFLSFFLAYFGTWLIYRARLPWLVALVYCAIILVNLNYIKQDLSYLVIIMLISLMLPIVSESTSGANFWNNLDNIWANITHGQFSLSSPGTLLQPYQTPVNFFGDQLSVTGNVNLPAGEVLYYTISSKSQSQYLEGFTYDNFDGHTWTSTTSNVGIQFAENTNLPIEAMGSKQQVTTTVTIVNPPEGTKHYLFAPSQPVSYSVPTTLYGNGIIATAWTQQNLLTPGESYQVKSLIPGATAQELMNIQSPQDNPNLWSNFDPSYLQTPPDLSSFPIVQRTLKQWTHGSTNVFSAMKALESHLRDQTQFKYSVTNPPVPSKVNAVAWLLQTHQGYCTYYASAMVIMARMLGIPARIVNGFTQGNFDLQHKVWVVNGEDAHSWVQVYFPGYGWINFDPTPGYSAPGGPTGRQSSNPVQTQPPTRSTPIATVGHQKPKFQPTPQPGSTGMGTNTTSSDAILRQNLFLTLSLATLFVSLVVFGLALLYRYKGYKLSTTTTASMVYRRVCRLGAIIGAPPQRWQTPYEYYRMLGRRFPRAAAPMRRITELFVRERWAAPHQELGPAEAQALEKLWPKLRNTLIRSFFSPHSRGGR